MRFGTNALVLAFRDPLVVAKQFATIDFLSHGRLLPVFGVGAAIDPYWHATGTSSKGRGRRANEAIDLIRRLLQQHEVAFEGEHYTYHGPGMRPRPAKPIPLWIGGNSMAALQRTADLGDGWLGSMIRPDIAGTARRTIEAALAANGRTIDPDHYGVTLILRIGSSDDPAVSAVLSKLSERLAKSGTGVASDLFSIGSADDVISTIRRYVDAGMSKFVVLPIANGFDDLMTQTQLLVRDVLPAVETTPVAHA